MLFDNEKIQKWIPIDKRIKKDKTKTYYYEFLSDFSKTNAGSKKANSKAYFSNAQEKKTRKKNVICKIWGFFLIFIAIVCYSLAFFILLEN